MVPKHKIAKIVRDNYVNDEPSGGTKEALDDFFMKSFISLLLFYKNCYHWCLYYNTPISQVGSRPRHPPSKKIRFVDIFSIYGSFIRAVSFSTMNGILN